MASGGWVFVLRDARIHCAGRDDCRLRSDWRNLLTLPDPINMKRNA
jgi:hypothetical protein